MGKHAFFFLWCLLSDKMLLQIFYEIYILISVPIKCATLNALLSNYV